MSESRNSSAFDLLHEKVRRWIWRQQWQELRDIQERSIPILLDGTNDLIVAASTASGKTEAAFLPIVSRLASDGRTPGCGFEAIYVSPLRALINDQFGRMESLCSEVGVPVWKWHGDVSANVKAQARKRPCGILLTTPESLEAILSRKGNEAARLFAALSYIVIDEMHAFMDSERGRHLQSIIHRVETAAGHKVARIGLSATLADMQSSSGFLRPTQPDAVKIIESKATSQELRLQVRGYMDSATSPSKEEGEAVETAPDATGLIVGHLFRTLRGHRSLVFAGSRQRVELITSGLCALCEATGVPEEFFAHHGSLSREHRESAEQRLKDESRPGSIVATTTMELGIDVGSIEAVAQIGPGMTVAGMRQRLGRSGRRAGQPAVMRIYITEPPVSNRSHPLDLLRPTIVQSVAMVRLMLRKWNEPPRQGRLHLSTLIHQILALMSQHGGITPGQAWSRLIASGTFPEVTKELFAMLLRRMGNPEVALLEQAPDGTLLPGREGERIIADRGFFSVFMSPEEYKVVTDRGKTLGTIPFGNPVMPEQLLIFAGRRWKVTDLNSARKEITVTPAYGGTPPAFGGSWLPPSDGVVAEMRAVWSEQDDIPFLDASATALLERGREEFTHHGLDTKSLLRHGDDVVLFPWVGGQAQEALVLALAHLGIKEVSSDGIAVSLPAREGDALLSALDALAKNPTPDAVTLAKLVPDMERAKFDSYLGTDLLARCYASERIDATRIPAMAKDLLARMPRGWMDT